MLTDPRKEKTGMLQLSDWSVTPVEKTLEREMQTHLKSFRTFRERLPLPTYELGVGGRRGGRAVSATLAPLGVEGAASGGERSIGAVKRHRGARGLKNCNKGPPKPVCLAHAVQSSIDERRRFEINCRITL